jgi:hypothetical protein
MAQFIAFDREAEVSGSIVCALSQAAGQDIQVQKILTKYSLDRAEPQGWYSLQNYLNVLSEISRNFGPHWLFNIGKNISQNAVGNEFDLEGALSQLDSSHHTQHRGGDSGYYKLVSYNKETKEAVIECRNPYPCYFDRGILTNLACRYKPQGASTVHVELEMHRPNRLSGADVSYYTIMWA